MNSFEETCRIINLTNAELFGAILILYALLVIILIADSKDYIKSELTAFMRSQARLIVECYVFLRVLNTYRIDRQFIKKYSRRRRRVLHMLRRRSS